MACLFIFSKEEGPTNLNAKVCEHAAESRVGADDDACTPTEATIPTLLKNLDRHHRPLLLILAFLVVILVGVVDYLSESELQIEIFYLAPIALVTWAVGRKAGLLLSVVSAGTWLVADHLSGEEIASPLVATWNALAVLGFFFIVALLLSQLQRELNYKQHLARTDSLTGALNRRAFYDAVTTEILRARRYQYPFTVAYLDVDDFKTINDRLGHSVGDRVLQRVVGIIAQNLRAIDGVARLGGDEFAILLPETDCDSAREVLDRLQGALAEAMKLNSWPVTFSIGVLTCQEPPSSADEVIKVADQLMYRVKTMNKNATRYSTYQR